jgi:aspartyl protease family protein
LSLDRLITFGVGVILLGVAAPYFAPGLIGGSPTADTVNKVAIGSTRAEGSKEPQLVPGYSRQVALAADESGHYFADATINGIAVRVMVDTGATMVALTADTARRLAIRPRDAQGVVTVSTANGVITATTVTIDHIRLGSVDAYNVDAAVLPQGALSVNLLGMSFLNKLSRFEAGGGQLVLVQ